MATRRLADPESGALLPPLSAADAVREVMARYTGQARVKSVTRTDPEHPPLELRHAVARGRVTLDDGTHFYVDANSGDASRERTRWWRFYDLMWGLHIMDLETREDTHNPLVIGFAIAALADDASWRWSAAADDPATAEARTPHLILIERSTKAPAWAARTRVSGSSRRRWSCSG